MAGADAYWLQWALAVVLTLFNVVYGGAILALFSQIRAINTQRDAVSERARQVTEAGDRDLWAAVDGLRRDMTADKADAAKQRSDIAEKLGRILGALHVGAD